MLATYGKMPNKKPKGFFKAVEFPVLAMLDKVTGDHRKLLSEGAGTRDLPLSIKFASKTSAMGGHDGAEVSGALFEVSVDPERGVMSGRGFLLDDENGRRHARLIATGAMRGNSVDLSEVKARFVEDFDTGDYWVEFFDFKLGATTGVSTPAFAEAHATVEDLDDDELVASMLADPMDPLIVQAPEEFSITVAGEPVEELTASGATLAPFEAFYMPEADGPQKIVVDPDGRVYGHLALWDSCHDGYSDRCMRVPRPNDGYASFNKPGVLTGRGQVETGPIFAFGGHRPAKSAKTIEQAYGGIENAWCDVRVTEGQFGPWISGVVRPGVSEETLYAVRASRISGHWVNGKLKAIVSVNVEGYDVPGSGDFAVDFSTGFSYAANDDGVLELVASFLGCSDLAEATDEPRTPAPAQTLSVVFNGAEDASKLMEYLEATLAQGPKTWSSTAFTLTGFASSTGTTTNILLSTEDASEEAAESDEGDDYQRWADDRLADLLEDDRDDS